MPSKADPCVMVIFGASGDLAERKLLPALYTLCRSGDLPAETVVLGSARTDWDDERFRDELRKGVREHAPDFDEHSWNTFANRLFYERGDAGKQTDFETLRDRTCTLDQQFKTRGNVLFYLSVKPSLFAPIVENIDRTGMAAEGRRWCSIDRERAAWQRIVVEKPFGRDLKSAEELNRTLGRVFDEESIYRIDHYLGKELVQNLLVLRFANSIFEPLWTHQYVDHVQITAAETVGVGDRAGYYDESGAVRDMIQSHLMQVLALVAMEPPTAFRADHIRSEKIKIIDAIEPIPRNELGGSAVFGQFASGDGQRAYHELDGVAENSRTETFAAVMFHFDNWRWAGTPFYLRTGKHLAAKRTEVVVEFKRPAVDLFRHLEPHASGRVRPANRIVIEIAPKPGVSLRFEGKVPGGGGGPGTRIDSVTMNFDYVSRFGREPAEAYGPLLLDVMRGDQTLFPHRLEVEAAWRAVMPLIGVESAVVRRDIRANYEPGSWGPQAADAMLARHGRKWHNVSV